MDAKIKEILIKFHPNPNEAVWKHKQSGQWIAKHKDLEIVAAAAGVVFNPPTVLQFDLEKKIAAFVVSGTMDKRTEWSVGEATGYNSQNQYYGSMAEKRGKDRVILKLIGLHGYVYSDNEIEEETHNAKKPVDTQNKKVIEKKKVSDTPKKVEKKVPTPFDISERLIDKIDTFQSFETLGVWLQDQKVVDARDGIYLKDEALSLKVDRAIEKKKESFVLSPSQSAGAALDDGRGGAFRND